MSKVCVFHVRVLMSSMVTSVFLLALSIDVDVVMCKVAMDIVNHFIFMAYEQSIWFPTVVDVVVKACRSKDARRAFVHGNLNVPTRPGERFDRLIRALCPAAIDSHRAQQNTRTER